MLTRNRVAIVHSVEKGIDMLRRACVGLIWIVVASCLSRSASMAAADRPNILWITAEDMSPTLGCYGDTYATTPHIDRLATESVRYTKAFATAPVCSPSRSCLITGCYATSLGTHQMRSAFPIPAEIRGFPAVLREAGYYTTNNVKTDYNTANWQEIVAASWDESSAMAHWRNRKRKDQPFFAVFNSMTSHQSRTMQWPYEQFVRDVQGKLKPEEIHDPALAPVPPYYPDTPVVRRTIARFYDCVTVMDQEAGAILRQLEEDGLADDTIVFFFSDHGSGMPRHKRCLFDSGMHVPLLVRFPEKFRRLAPANAGETVDRLVSFVDFGSTVLSLAGAEPPAYMQGTAFLGEGTVPPREYVHGHRDRIDEAIDCARSVRDGRYLYILNFMPHLGYNQPSAWPDAGEINQELTRLTNRETMTDAQWQFCGPTRPIEELYDCESDPLNLHNLSGIAEHNSTLMRLRGAFAGHILESRDLGYLPEIEAWGIVRQLTMMPLADCVGTSRIYSLIPAADLIGRGGETDFAGGLNDRVAAIRYWSVIRLAGLTTLSPESLDRLDALLLDPSADVRIAAASVLARHRRTKPAIEVLAAALESDDLTVVMYAARALELLGETARPALPAMQAAARRAQQILPPDTASAQPGDQDLAMFIQFSTGAFLRGMESTGQGIEQKETKGTKGTKD